MFRAGIARPVLAVELRRGEFLYGLAKHGKSRQGGLGPVVSGTASRGEVWCG